MKPVPTSRLNLSPLPDFDPLANCNVTAGGLTDSSAHILLNTENTSDKINVTAEGLASTDAASENVTPPVLNSTPRSDTAVSGLFVLASLFTLYFARAVILPVILAILFSILLSPSVRSLRRFGVPEALGALVVLLALVMALALAIDKLAEPATEWLNKAPQSLNQLERKTRPLKIFIGEMRRVMDRITSMTRAVGEKQPREVVVENTNWSGILLGQTQFVLVSSLSTLILLYFLLASGDTFLRKLVRVLPTLRDKVRAIEVTREIQREIGRYFLTVGCINGALGAITAIAMWILGMPNPILWGVMVAVLNFIPYVGPTVSLITLSLAALVTFDEISQALLVPLVFIGITLLEGQLLQPIIVGRRLALNPVVIFLSFLLWGWLWGIAGMLIAVPLLVTLKICCDRLEPLAPIAEFISRE
jgi:predicted PurR-regulated permease PerM